MDEPDAAFKEGVSREGEGAAGHAVEGDVDVGAVVAGPEGEVDRKAADELDELLAVSTPTSGSYVGLEPDATSGAMLVQMNDDDRQWRIGELARASGLTVRALHHYDQIGLLCPSLRTDGGHRLYTEQEAARLYEIVALRGLGLQLEQVRELLTTDLDPRALLGEQLRTLTVQLKAGARLRKRLTVLLAALDTPNQPTANDLLGLVQQTVAVERLAAEYLSPDQMERLGRRHSELGGPATALIKNELPRLYRQALAEFDAGTDPADPVVRAIAEQIDEVSAVLSGGDDKVTGSVRRMWAERGEEVFPGTGIPWAALVEYLDRARHPDRAPEPDGSWAAPEKER